MKRTKIKIPIYDSTIILIHIEGKQDKDKILKEMKSFNCPQEDIEDVQKSIEEEDTNGGWTFRKMGLRLFLVMILPCVNEEIRRDIVAHEKRHVEDRLLQHCSIDDIEASAYLAGYLARYMY